MDLTIFKFGEISSLGLSDDILYGFSELGTDEFGVRLADFAGNVGHILDFDLFDIEFLTDNLLEIFTERFSNGN